MFDLSNGAIKSIRPCGLVGATSGTGAGLPISLVPSKNRPSGVPPECPRGVAFSYPRQLSGGRAIRAGKPPAYGLNFAATPLLGSLDWTISTALRPVAEAFVWHVSRPTKHRPPAYMPKGRQQAGGARRACDLAPNRPAPLHTARAHATRK